MDTTRTITETTVLLRLEFRRLGNSRKGDLGQVTTDADKDRLRLSKVLFDCPQYKALGTFDNALRAWILSRALDVPAIGFSGTYILPVSLLEATEARLRAAIEEREALVLAFLETYIAQRETARVELGTQFRESDYPDVQEAAKAFGVSWRYVTFEIPKSLPPELLERERENMRVQVEDMTTQVREALRETLSGLLGHLTERLTPGADGARKIFRDSAVSNLQEFLELFSGRNVTGDAELSNLAEKARAIVTAAVPEHLRDKGRQGEDLRTQVARQAGEVKAAVDALIQTESRRRFNLDDDGPVAETPKAA